MSSYITDDKALLCSLPFALARDDDKENLAAAVANELVKLIVSTDNAAVFPRIDKLPEQALDILAYDLKIDWYEADAPIRNKRRAVKDCILVHKYKGTKYAVETALKSVYDSAKVAEWFEYGGEPFHFRVSIFGSAGSGLKTLYLKIQYAKNLRSVMDNVVFILSPSDIEIFAGARLAALEKQICAALKSQNNDVFTVKNLYYAGLIRGAGAKYFTVRLGVDIPPADPRVLVMSAGGRSMQCVKHIWSRLGTANREGSI